MKEDAKPWLVEWEEQKEIELEIRKLNDDINKIILKSIKDIESAISNSEKACKKLV